MAGLSFPTIAARSRHGGRTRQLPGGSLAVGAVEEQRLVPIARLIDGKVVFLCHNDPVPTDGLVIGLAAPSLQHEIDALPSADTEESTRESTRESTQQSTEESAQEPTRESAEESTHDTAHSTDSPPGANRSKRGSA
jgi:hypothetical protein